MLNYSSTRTPPMVSALPNFFIVGAPKAGTTSLYYYLGQHPDVYMSPVKEPNYFAEEIRLCNIGAQWQDWAQRENDSLQQYLLGPMQEKRFGGIVSNWTDYLKLFQNVNGEKAIGEASVCYLWSRTAARNIASTTPNAKIIMVLRNPVDRAFSQYKQAVASGLIGKSFREQVRKSLNNKSGVWSQLKNAIPDDLIPVVRKLAFKSRETVELDSADRVQLSNYYREDVVRLSGLIKRDLHAWLE